MNDIMNHNDFNTIYVSNASVSGICLLHDILSVQLDISRRLTCCLPLLLHQNADNYVAAELLSQSLSSLQCDSNIQYVKAQSSRVQI